MGTLGDNAKIFVPRSACGEFNAFLLLSQWCEGYIIYTNTGLQTENHKQRLSISKEKDTYNGWKHLKTSSQRQKNWEALKLKASQIIR